MLAILLGLAAGIGWGVSDFIAGLAGRRVSPIMVGFIAQVTGLIVVALILLSVRPEGPSGAQIQWGALAGVCVAVGTIGLYQGLSAGSMSLIAPISSVGVLVPVAFGIAEGERPSALAWAGAAMVIGGLLVCGGARGPASRHGLAWAGLAALGFGFFFVTLDRASVDGALWANGASWTSSMLVLAVVVVLVGAHNAPRPRSGVLMAGVGGVLAVSATLGFALATQRGLLSLVAVLASLYPAVTLALAQVTLGERLGGLQWVGIATVLAGVAGILAGS